MTFVVKLRHWHIVCLLLAALLINTTDARAEISFGNSGGIGIAAKGNRLLGIHVNEAQDNNYHTAFIEAKSVGIDFVSLHFLWGTGGIPGLGSVALAINADGTTFDGTFLDIANSYYPAFNMKVVLTIAPVDTELKAVPRNLVDKAFDDPLMIDRFKLLLDFIFSRIPNLDLVSLQIGNEVDLYLGTDPAAWSAYQTFQSAVAAYARTKRPGLKVGVTATFDGLTNPNSPKKALLQALNQTGDVVGVTYYPIDFGFTMKDPSTVSADFAALVAAYPDTPIYMHEAGYASGSMYMASSEWRQKEFVQEVFKAWDQYQTHMPVLSFFNLTDWSQTEVDGLGFQYGLCPGSFCNPFKEFLGTLGLRAYFGSGIDKEAFIGLKSEAAARGWFAAP